MWYTWKVAWTNIEKVVLKGWHLRVSICAAKNPGRLKTFLLPLVAAAVFFHKSSAPLNNIFSVDIKILKNQIVHETGFWMQFFKADIHFPRNPLGCVLLAVWQEWSVGGVTNSHRIPTKYPTTTFKKLPETPKSRGRNKTLSKTQSWKPKFRSNPSEIFKHICLHLWLPRYILHASKAQLNLPRSKVCSSAHLFSNPIVFLF